MSFDIKYDRDGVVIQQPEQVFQEQPAEQPMAAAPEVEQEIQEEVPTVEQPVQEVQQSYKPAPQESWKMLREKAERAERRAEELERMIYEAQSPKQADAEEDLNVSVDDDSLVEGKHLSKVNKKIQNLERQLKQYEQQTSLSSAEIKLKTQYPDFDRVV